MSYGVLTTLRRWEANDHQNQSTRNEFLYLGPHALTQAFRELFGPIHKGTLLELGCGGGYFCCQLARWIGLEKIVAAAGIDWSEPLGQDFRISVSNLGLPTTFIQANLLDPELVSTAPRSDVVISGGLVEHFVGLDFHNILDLHHQLLRPNGKLVISFPNLLGIRYLWHRLFDYQNLNDHSLDAMRPEIISNFFRERGYRIDLVAYYGQNRLWWNSQENHKLTKIAGHIGLKIYNKLLSKVMDWSTPRHPSLLSPYCMIIATKIENFPAT
jgi:2-polyprenyl-3-methyl-5-hydroxy-6-metoxy-1,4-benzoquinol methylase